MRSVLEPLAQPSGAHDDRNREQRLADALVERVSGGRPANIQVTATIETLKGLAGAAAGEMEFSLPLSSTSVQRMACDCSVTRVLLSQESVTIDVGRSKRVISGPARKALMARDGHCRWPGCERPASWCDGHHLVHWIHGGTTDLDNLVLLSPAPSDGARGRLAADQNRIRPDHHPRAVFPIHGEVPAVGGGWGLPSDCRAGLISRRSPRRRCSLSPPRAPSAGAPV